MRYNDRGKVIPSDDGVKAGSTYHYYIGYPVPQETRCAMSHFEKSAKNPEIQLSKRPTAQQVRDRFYLR